jgi:hypothetical protein
MTNWGVCFKKKKKKKKKRLYLEDFSKRGEMRMLTSQTKKTISSVFKSRIKRRV